jgi:hypothetical protein
MRHVLVVANQTLGGKDLLDTLRSRLEGEECDFWVVVPATPSADDHVSVLVGPGGGAAAAGSPPSHADPYAVAEDRLEHGIERIRTLGAPVGGEVGNENPVHAVRDALARRQFDEIVISTLPGGVSRWLHTDLPSRVQRAFHLPVTVVTARAPGRR